MNGEGGFRVLLMAMPDVASSFDRVMRLPNLGLASLAAHARRAEVHILDLVAHSRGVGEAVRRAVEDTRPHLVGLSAMTFQYDTAKQVAALVREVAPRAKIVLGGYHATLAYEEIAADPEARSFDFLVRGEGEETFRRLVEALRAGGSAADIPGLSYRVEGTFRHPAPPPLRDLTQLPLPARGARRGGGFHYFGRPFDVVETSRGCTKACGFCSIRHMYGGEHRTYPISRVIEDIRAAEVAGAKGVFFADDNINLEPGRLQRLCEAIVEAGLDHLEYVSQADVAGFVREPELPAAMRRAGFSDVFLGIESVAEKNWKFLRKANSRSRTEEVVRALRAQGLSVTGGFIVGTPEEDARAVRAAFRQARAMELDHAIMWCLTPYPGTEVRNELTAQGLVADPDGYRGYNGYICHIRTRHLSHRQLVRLLATEGLKLYFHPRFMFRGRVWGRRRRYALAYLQCSLEYLTRAYGNRLYASRHRM